MRRSERGNESGSGRGICRIEMGGIEGGEIEMGMSAGMGTRSDLEEAEVGGGGARGDSEEGEEDTDCVLLLLSSGVAVAMIRGVCLLARVLATSKLTVLGASLAKIARNKSAYKYCAQRQMYYPTISSMS